MDIVSRLRAELGEAAVLTGADMAPFTEDWTRRYHSHPLAVVRPASTDEVAAVMRLASAEGVPVVPVSGNTGLSGGTHAEGALMLSLARMSRILEIRDEARLAIVEAGVVLSALHEAAAVHGLAFPVFFGARGSAMIGGILSTNAGGSNVLRYGNTRALCLGLEAVLADGRVLNLMTELYKDNSGYDLRDLLIGSEGTLAVITRAVLKLVEAPRVRATAMVAVPSLSAALRLLNRLQSASGGAVEAFEYMPGNYIRHHLEKFPQARPPFAEPHEVNILVELASAAERDATPLPDGTVPLAALLEHELGEAMAEGEVLDAVIARNEAQRAEMWARREAAAEVALTRLPLVNNDVAVPLDKVETFLERMEEVLPRIDPDAEAITVAHLGDGNIHYTVWPGRDEPAHLDAIMEAVEDVALELGGSFSAEHGIGLTKKPSMARRKDQVALEVMRAVKAALDPKGILNPGKVLP
ncbi:MAG: FAD-binding oxidoreductase [Alphaproteobacteria bacterium]|nr:MAG: FAD-binding oxidoreductase [Alphaproteobacteria bacterium]